MAKTKEGLMKPEEIAEIEAYARKVDELQGSAGPPKDEHSLLACIILLLIEQLRRSE